jgi:hypothetical protein
VHESLKQDFRIGVGPEPDAARGKLLAKFQIVVYLPIKDNDGTGIRINHGLMPTGRQVNDGETPMTKRNSPAKVRPRIVRTSVREGIQRDLE